MVDRHVAVFDHPAEDHAKELLQTGYFLQDDRECPRQESNLRTRFRKRSVEAG